LSKRSAPVMNLMLLLLVYLTMILILITFMIFYVYTHFVCAGVPLASCLRVRVDPDRSNENNAYRSRSVGNEAEKKSFAQKILVALASLLEDKVWYDLINGPKPF
jgi:hypothetical protein